MDNVLGRFKGVAQKMGNWLSDIVEVFDSEDPLLVLPYRGYANAEKFFLKGRVLENENIFNGKSEKELRNIIDSFRRFETDEIPFAKVKVSINGQSFEAETDEEGYFIVDRLWDAPLEDYQHRWLKANVELLDPLKKDGSSANATGDIYLPSRNADYGIITDIDDTVLQTHVSSMFRLKMLYATFVQDGHQRLPMEGIVQLFEAFVKGSNGKRENPIFYVSNGPWNIYDLLVEFMEVQQLPKGPVMLRDYGINPSGDFSGHKLNSIEHILNSYPELPFIMLGDTGSKDADFYIELARKFPDRIKAIYIRQTRNTKNSRRVAQLIESTSDIDAILINHSSEIFDHARGRGFFK